MDLDQPVDVVALAGAAVAVVALLLAVWTALWVRRVRRAQRAVLAGENVDLVEFAVGMQAQMEHVEATVAGWRGDLTAGLGRLDAALQRRAIVRYDALGEDAGHHSVSVALLDAGGNGVVLTALQGADPARVYVKDVVEGRPGSVELTPEERQAVERALG